jgi:hypothetical protein
MAVEPREFLRFGYARGYMDFTWSVRAEHGRGDKFGAARSRSRQRAPAARRGRRGLWFCTPRHHGANHRQTREGRLSRIVQMPVGRRIDASALSGAS